MSENEDKQTVANPLEPVVSEIIKELLSEVGQEVHYKSRSFKAVHDTAQALLEQGLYNEAAVTCNSSVTKFTDFENRLIKIISKLSR